jgi:hypothetical protein
MPPGTPETLVLVNVIAVPGQTVVSVAVNDTVGGGYTVIAIVYVLTELPLVAVSVTTCVPGTVKLVDGLVSTDELEPPNAHE